MDANCALEAEQEPAGVITSVGWPPSQSSHISERAGGPCNSNNGNNYGNISSLRLESKIAINRLKVATTLICLHFTQPT